ncbi:MAG: hypothetical protein PW734_10035 [Verrucomicrobium sp.]|nr:hypothetical protein [Verrucomicrobium sp.]
MQLMRWRQSRRRESGRVGPEILLALAIVACGVCIGALYYQTQQDVQSLHASIDTVQARSDSNVKQLETQLGQRYLQLLKLAEDLAMQQGRMVTLERNLTLQKNSVTQLQDTFHGEVDSLKKEGGARAKEVSLLEDKFKNAIALKEKSITQLQEEYDVLKNLMDDQSALLVMMREQAIVNGGSTNSSGAIPPGGPDAVLPVANPGTQSPLAPGIPPAGSQGPQSFQTGAIVPIPSTEAPQPTTQPPPPMPIHDADQSPAAPAQATAPQP